MFQYILKTTLFVIGLSLLTACQGKNPFDRTNDPTKDFGNLSQDSAEYQQLENKEIEKLKYENEVLRNQINAKNQEQKNAQSTCGRVYDMDMIGTEGGRLDFVENVSKTYKLKVRSYLTNDYTLQIEKAPDSGVQITKSEQPGEWNITWQPSSGLISERSTFFTGPLKVAFVPKTGSAAAQSCLNSKFVEDFSVTVALDSTTPVLTVEELKKTFRSKEGQAQISVQVNDPAATSNRPPLVSPVPISSVTADGSQVPLISSCSAAKATSTPQTWTFDCFAHFQPLNSKIEAAKNGDTLKGVVAFKAISQRTGKSTPDVPREILIVVDEPNKVLPPVEPDQAPSTGIVPIPTPRPDRD